MDLESIKSASEFIEHGGHLGNAYFEKHDPIASFVGEDVFKSIVDLTSSEDISEISETHSGEISLVNVHSLHAWKLTDVYAAKVIELKEAKVILEVVYDKEAGVTQELLFDRTDFDGLEISHGTFLRLNCYKRPNAQMMQIIKGHHVSDDDFPQINLEQFTNRPLFRKKLSER